MFFDLVEPRDGMLECVPARDVEHDQGPSDALVIGPSDGLEGLRAGLRVTTPGYRVPDLQLDVHAVVCDRFVTVFHPDRDVVLVFEPLIRKLQQQTRLAHSYPLLHPLPVSPIRINLNK